LYIGIGKKFILLLSLLIASLLAVQFYFNQKAQKDLLNEIERLSLSINRATDEHFREVLKSLQEQRKAEYKNGAHWIDTNVFSEKRSDDSLYVKIHEEILRIKQFDFQLDDEFNRDVERLIDDHGTVIFRDKEIFPREKTDEIQKNAAQIYEKIAIAPEKVDPIRKQKYSKNYEVNFENRAPIRAIDINLNWTEKHLKNDSQSHQIYRINNNETSVYSFTIPDYSIPENPQFLRYSYSTAELNHRMGNLRNRNLLFTSLLFLVSVFGVYFISRKFTRPIKSLKTAFESLEKGDLGISVSSNNKDEIGDLTNSFNQMVDELQKNRELEKILKHKEKLASMGTLAAGVAHEIKNPLNAINLTIEHLQDKYTSAADKQAQLYIRTIQEEIKRLDKVVNNFLSFIRSENLEKQKTDVNKLLSDIIHLFQREFETQNIVVEMELSPGFELDLDSERFKTVIVNIVLNAIQAMPEGGLLKITSNFEKKSITISDSGDGIPKDRIDRIFDLFYTTKSSGTGLGLPTAYKIVKEHRGDIQISSEVERGTKVIIFL
jgi:signal transduction histidine kinase